MAATPGADARRDALTDPHLLEAILRRCQPSLSNARDAGTTGWAIAGVNRLFRRVALERLPWAADINSGRVVGEGSRRALAAWTGGRRLQTLVLGASFLMSEAQANICADLLERSASHLLHLRVTCDSLQIFEMVCGCEALTRLDLDLGPDSDCYTVFPEEPILLQSFEEHNALRQLAALVHLRELSLASSLWDDGTFVRLGWLTELRQLSYLSLLNYTGPGVPGTAVRRLEVGFEPDFLRYLPHNAARFCLAEWASPHLTFLALREVSVAGPPPGAPMACVSALRELELQSLCVHAESLSCLCEGGVQLTRLRLDGEAVEEGGGFGLPASLKALELKVLGEVEALWPKVFALQALTALQVTARHFCPTLQKAQQWALDLAAGLSGMPSLVAGSLGGYYAPSRTPAALRELVEPSFDGLKGPLAARGGHFNIDGCCVAIGVAPGCMPEAGW